MSEYDVELYIVVTILSVEVFHIFHIMMKCWEPSG